MHNSGQSSKNPSSTSMAYKGNFLSVLVTTSQSKNSWIIGSSASNHMTNAYHLFTSYSPWADNPKIRVTDGSLSTFVIK